MIQFFLLKTTSPPTPSINIYRENFGEFAKLAKNFDFRRNFLFRGF